MGSHRRHRHEQPPEHRFAQQELKGLGRVVEVLLPAHPVGHGRGDVIDVECVHVDDPAEQRLGVGRSLQQPGHGCGFEVHDTIRRRDQFGVLGLRGGLPATQAQPPVLVVGVRLIKQMDHRGNVHFRGTGCFTPGAHVRRGRYLPTVLDAAHLGRMPARRRCDVFRLQARLLTQGQQAGRDAVRTGQGVLAWVQARSTPMLRRRSEPPVGCGRWPVPASFGPWTRRRGRCPGNSRSSCRFRRTS